MNIDSGEYTPIKLTKSLAFAIIEMDNIAWSEGLGPETDKSCDAWRELLAQAETVTDQKADCTRFQET